MLHSHIIRGFFASFVLLVAGCQSESRSGDSAASETKSADTVGCWTTDGWWMGEGTIYQSPNDGFQYQCTRGQWTLPSQKQQIAFYCYWDGVAYLANQSYSFANGIRFCDSNGNWR